MKKRGIVVVFCSLLGGCAGGEIVHLANSANQQVQCGPFSAKAPVAQYFEERFGAPGAAAQLGDDAETKLRMCIEDYQRQGYEPERLVKPTAVAAELAKPIYEAAAAADQGDYATVFRNMRALAARGDTRAQTVLGKAYHDGLGVPQNYVQAHKWYNLAAATSATSGSEKELRDIAFAEREALAALMSREQIAEAQNLAREWKPSLAR